MSHEVEQTGQLDYELALAESAGEVGEWSYASVVLERIVARDPSQAGARLDLVVISLQSGDTLTAARHLRVLETIPDKPPIVTLLVQQLNDRLKPADEAFVGKMRFQGSLGFGYDTNPNLGVFADAIDLVIDGTPVALVPDATLAPQEAFFMGGALGMEYAYSPNGLVSVSAMLRGYEGLSDEDNMAVAARLYQRLRSNRFLEVVLADFRTAEGLYLSRAGLGVRQRFGECRCNSIGVLGDVLQGSERSSEAQRVAIELESARDLGPLKFLLYGSASYDRQPEARWGDTLGMQAGADATVNFGKNNGRGTVGVSLYKGWDDHSYSPLFGNSHRDLVRGTVRLGLSYPLGRGLEAFADWSFSRQESGIVLFEYKRQVSAIGLRLSF
ncbi:MAG: hypothetical protein WC997_06765 [Porticoccaceae bacterium]